MQIFLILAALFSPSVFAAPACWQCISGFPGYDIPVHGYPSSSREHVAREAVRSCRLIVPAWRKDPSVCVLKRCQQTRCVVSDPGNEPPRGPWCNQNSECGFGSLCIGGKCVRKDDPFRNKCSADSDCGGAFDRTFGRCVMGQCR